MSAGRSTSPGVLKTALACLALALLPTAQAQSAEAERPAISVGVMTRLMVELEPLETELAQGATGERLSVLLDPAFLERHADGSVMGRVEALRALSRSAAAQPAAVITNLQIHEVGDVALAEFQRPATGREPSTWVLDAWRRDSTNQWRLRVRFVAPSSRQPDAIPHSPRVPPYGPGAPASP